MLNRFTESDSNNTLYEVEYTFTSMPMKIMGAIFQKIFEKQVQKMMEREML